MAGDSRVVPGLVDKNRVRADAQNLGADLLELLVIVGGLRQFRGANEGEVRGVEQQNHPLALVAQEPDFLDLFLVEYFELKVSYLLTNLNHSCHLSRS